MALWALRSLWIFNIKSTFGGDEMPKYKIGITEAGDAGLDLSWLDKLDAVDGAIVITKCVSPDFYDAVLSNKDKLIVYVTVKCIKT